MTSEPNILLSLEDRPQGKVARVTINRPRKLNALDPAAIEALRAVAEQLQAREDLRAVILTGAGDRAFAGGADFRVLAGLDQETGEAFITSLHRMIAAFRAIPVPVIARINGYCLGGALELAAGCDLRIASDNAVMGMPEVKIGVPSVIEAALLPRLIGWGRASEMVLTGENIDAARAERIGLVEAVVPLAELDAAVEKRIAAILAAGPNAIRLQKKLMRQWESLTPDEAIRAGIAIFRESYATDEAKRFAHKPGA